MNADTGSAQLYIRDAGVAPVTAYTIEVSTRPMIGLVWLGTVLISFGGLLSMRRRILENRAAPAPTEDALGADSDGTSAEKPQLRAGSKTTRAGVRATAMSAKSNR